MHKPLLTFFFVALAQLALCWPISPQSLRKLILNSDLIVIAKVHDKMPEPKQPTASFDSVSKTQTSTYSFNWGDGIADLNIIEILNGKIDNNESIKVIYEPNMVCPAPARYDDESTVIAFLSKTSNSNIYETTGLSYGSKIMANDDEIKAYKTAISEFLILNKIRDKNQRNIAIANWLLQCSLNTYTQHEGIMDLDADVFETYRFNNQQPFSSFLNSGQLRQLDSLFFATDTLNYYSLDLVPYISTSNHSRLKAHLVKNLAYSDQFQSINIMQLISKKWPNKNLEPILKSVANLDSFDDDAIAKMKPLIKKFIGIVTQ